MVLAASKDGVTVVGKPEVTANNSVITIGVSVIGDRDKSTGQSGEARETTISLAGSHHAEWDYNHQKGVLNVAGTGPNGVATLGAKLQKFPFLEGLGQALEAAAPGPIQYDLNFTVSESGQVGFTGNTKGFPTYAAYFYTKDDDGNVQTTRLFVRPENTIDDLDKPMTPIPQ